MNPTPFLAVRSLAIAFDLGAGGTVEAVRGVSFEIPQRETVALVGESGSGKTVSAMSLVRLLPPNARIDPKSQVLRGGEDLLRLDEGALRRIRGREIGMVFQDPMSSLNPVQTIGQQIGEVLRIHHGLSARQAQPRVLELIDEVGLPQARARALAYPHQLSGGQQQRAMIAMAIACEPALLIADEPTTALDVTVQRQIIDLLLRLQQSRQMSMLFISHDLSLVGELAHRVVVMRAGEVREQGRVEEIFHHPRDPYTRALLACRPGLDTPAHGGLYRLPTIEHWSSPLAPIPELEAEAEPAPTGASPATPASPETPVTLAATAGAGPGQGHALAAAPLLAVQGLAKTYTLAQGWLRRVRIEAVRDVAFTLERGRTLGVVGESGSGKSTLGLMITRLLEPTRGEIRFGGEDVSRVRGGALQAWRRRVQIIFQNPYASLNPRFTVRQILLEPLRIHRVGANAGEREALAVQWLERVGLSAQALGKYPHEFSGGQRQRIAIARALTMQPEVVVCDECVSALDVSVQATVLNLLLDLQASFGLSYVFISHDLAVVKFMADEILVLREGSIVERGPAHTVYAAPQHPYTQQLLAAIPRGLARRPSLRSDPSSALRA